MQKQKQQFEVKQILNSSRCKKTFATTVTSQSLALEHIFTLLYDWFIFLNNHNSFMCLSFNVSGGGVLVMSVAENMVRMELIRVESDT